MGHTNYQSVLVKKAFNVLTTALIVLVGAIGASAMVTLFPQINLRAPGITWFPIPSVVIAVAIVGWCEQSCAYPIESQQKISGVRIFALSLMVALIGLTLTGWNHILTGTASVPGAEIYPMGIFSVAYPLVFTSTTGILEEAIIRGWFQLKLTPQLGAIGAQLGAAVVFVVLHGAHSLDSKHLLLLLTVALISGYLTNKSKSVLPASLFHALSNTVTVVVVMAYR